MERRRSWVAMPFPGSAHVAAGPRYPPTLVRARRAGALSEGSLVRVEEDGGRGLRWSGGTHMSIVVSNIGCFMVVK